MRTYQRILLFLLFCLTVTATLVVGLRALHRAPTVDAPAFDETEMAREIDEAWRAGAKELRLRYAAGEHSAAALRQRAETHLALLGAESPRYRYAVREADCAAEEGEGAVELRLRFWYQTQDPAWDELPKAADAGEAAAIFASALRRGETVFTFLAEGAWTSDELNLLSAALMANASELAAESGMYHYEVSEGSLEPCALVCVEAEYPVEAELLGERTAELRETLDALAAELKAGGGDERALFLAAARAVAERARFDEALAAVNDTEALTEEQRLARSAWGALCGGETVCTGYAMAFKALCDRLELPCWVVTGRHASLEHAWNALELDGETLYIDCTFADILGDESYLLMDGRTLSARGYVFPTPALFPWNT